jgi:hypothetical protein
VLELRDEPGFPTEALVSLRTFPFLGAENFEGDLPAEVEIPGPVDNSYPSSSEFVQDLVTKRCSPDRLPTSLVIAE